MRGREGYIREAGFRREIPEDILERYAGRAYACLRLGRALGNGLWEASGVACGYLANSDVLVERL